MYNMSDIKHRDATVVAFRGPMYVLPFSLLALVVVLLGDLLNVIAYLHVLSLVVLLSW
jgi:hypothetical protein